MVKGRYSPDAIEVRRGMPVKLNFRRDEDTPCSEQVILSAFHAGARLAPYQTTSVDFVPDRCGDFLFTCAMGMYQGRIVVVEPSQRDLNKARRAAQLQAVKGGAWEEARRTGVVRDASAQRGFRLPDGPQPGSASGRTSGGAPGIQAITGTGQHPED